VVDVLDANDNAPVLSDHHYTLSVPENSPVGSSVGFIEASDADTGANARLFYSLTTLSTNKLKVLDVDPDSGTVFVYRRLDFENSDVELEYDIRVLHLHERTL